MVLLIVIRNKTHKPDPVQIRDKCNTFNRRSITMKHICLRSVEVIVHHRGYEIPEGTTLDEFSAPIITKMSPIERGYIGVLVNDGLRNPKGNYILQQGDKVEIVQSQYVV